MWTVTIAGLSSTNPRTGYKPPHVDAVGVLTDAVWSVALTAEEMLDMTAFDAATLASIATNGSQALVLVGDAFGAADLGVDVIVTGSGLSEHGRRATVTASECEVVIDHVVVRCVMPVGVGTSYQWTVTGDAVDGVWGAGFGGA